MPGSAHSLTHRGGDGREGPGQPELTGKRVDESRLWIPQREQSRWAIMIGKARERPLERRELLYKLPEEDISEEREEELYN